MGVCAAVTATMASVPARAATPAATATPSSAGPTHDVIVVLRNQHTDLAITRGRASARSQAFGRDQAPLLGTVRKWGAKKLHGFATVNAFSASLTASETKALAANTQVRAVYPDLPVTATPVAAQHPATSTRTSSSVESGPICPTSPSAPLLEPQALGLTNTAFAQRSTPQAQSVATGAGVKVAFIADGIDVNNQDFIRADGSHVFIDYKDFSGDGPNAPTSGAEAFGDASAIAAQGRHSYDLSDFVNPAHPLPEGCTITVRGVAPGASLIGLKVFGQAPTAPTSRFIEAIDYAVSAGADVLNESFGANPYPDNGNDPITLADLAAVAAGVTVVASTGDAGNTGTVGSPASSATPGIIGVAASTSFQSYAQTTESGFQFSNGTWANNNISGLSSGGITQRGTTPDLVAPGDLGWALCSTDSAVYQSCVNDAGGATPIQEFGGTSQSSPLTAGAVALVYQAYEKTHHGARPSPALVKRLITGTATDLGHPAYEQGAGLLNSLAAVKAAQSWHDANGSPARTGDALVMDKTQLTTFGYPHTPAIPLGLTVTNDGAAPQTVDATTRALTRTVKTITGTTSIDTATAPTYTDSFGIQRSYAKVTFTVPAGIDRLTMRAAFDNGPAAGGTPIAATRIILIDPHGTYTAYSIPQGASNYANVDTRYPKAGTWSAYLALSATSGFSGPLKWAATLSDYARHGIVVPSHFTLAPGASRKVYVLDYASEQPGDLSASVQLASNRGLHTSVPLTIRTVVPPRRTTFTGAITGGNGRATLGPAQSNNYYIQVPAHRRDLSVGVAIALPRPPGLNDLEGYVIATLRGPNGQTYGYDSNFNDGNIQFYRATPQPGIWVLSIEALNPVQGNLIDTGFTARVDYDTVRASASLPHHGRLAAGKTVTVPVRVTNTGTATLNYYADPRLSQSGTIQLTTINGVDSFPLPQPAGLTPQWQVPSQSTSFTAGVTGDQPVNLDVFYLSGQPDLYAANSNNSASVTFSASEVSPGLFGADVGQSGPFGDGGAAAGTATMTASVQGKLFDLDTTSDTSDIMLSSALAQGPAAAAKQLARAAASHHVGRGVLRAGSTPAPSTSTSPVVTPTGGLLTLAPGQTGVITVTITPTAAVGSHVSGHLYLDTFDLFTGGGDELVDLPYDYTVTAR